MPRTSGLTYDIVPEDVADETRKHSDSRQWAGLLEDGKMLRMSKRPQWTKTDKNRTGKRLKTRAASDGTDDVNVWLEEDPNTAQPDSVESEFVNR